jgi:hypothetical protein
MPGGRLAPRRAIDWALAWKRRKELGSGFIEHPANGALRDAIERGALSSQAMYEELLRLVYRLIFLFTTEDRGLLHDPDATDAAKALYADGYGAARLRNHAARRAARDTNHDLYEGLKIVFRSLWHGERALGLPALGGLFRIAAMPNLGGARISNKRLLEAVFRMAWITEDHTLMRVNWRDMETEELGSVYEALLELPPRIDLEVRSFFFAEGDETSGNARKRSGSYYTPDSLVQLLLDRALDPVIDRTVNENSGREVAALLDLSVIDPACGSGHFLLAAGRRLATRVAQLRSPGAPSAEDWRHALREVARRCLFGVDRNPMAVELCQTALWIESVDPGKPLTLLEGHIQCGDSLIGVWDLTNLVGGIPDEAYKPLTGDDKEAAAAWRKLNKAERDRPPALPFSGPPPALVAAARALDELPEDKVGQVEAKASRLADFHRQTDWRSLKAACDLFVAAFFMPKIEPPDRYASQTLPTTRVIWNALEGGDSFAVATACATESSGSMHVFHWPLAFPQVLARGGFDVVLGNPPWDTMSPDAKEFFSPYDGSIRFMSPDDQKKRIEELKALPDAQTAWDAYCRHLYCAANFMKESGRYRLFAEGNLGKGDFNIYRMFVELALRGTRTGGRAAQIVPENLYNGANAAAIRQHLFEHTNLSGLIAFENTKKIWFDIDTRQKFCLYVAEPGGKTDAFGAAFGVNSAEKLSALASGLPIKLPVSLVIEFSPDALAIAEVAHPSEIEVSKKVYARFPKFGSAGTDLSRRQYMRELDMGNDREDFGNDPDGVPLYEGRMVDAFDHRAKGYVLGHGRASVWAELSFGDSSKKITPQWRVREGALPEKVRERFKTARIGFCDVASPTNQRALVACLIPPGAICGDKVPTILFDPVDPRLDLFWLGVANSFVMDFLVRKKVALKMSYTLMDSLPLPRMYSGSETESSIASRVLRLTATGAELGPFWEVAATKFSAIGGDLDPTEDINLRQRLRSEIDVLVARDVFGLARDEMRYVLDPGDILGRDCGFETFGALMRVECKAHNAFVTRDLILATWDSLPRTNSAPDIAADKHAVSITALAPGIHKPDGLLGPQPAEQP